MRYKGHVFDLYIVDICKDSMSANYFSGVSGFPLSLVSLCKGFIIDFTD